MASLVESLSQFLIYIGIGSILFLPVVSLKDTGAGYGKLVHSVAFFSFITAGVLWSTSSLVLDKIVYLNLGLLFIGIIANYSMLSRSKEPLSLNKMFYFLFLIQSLSLIYIFQEHSLIDSIYSLLGILFVGSTVFLMLLGHYYLVVPKLSERPLIILHYLLWTVLGAKVLISLYSYINIQAGHLDLWDQVFIWMRVLWGYVAIGVLSYFSYRLSKMRSTQSATGILYVIVFFMIIGELVSYYLYNSKGFLI